MKFLDIVIHGAILIIINLLVLIFFFDSYFNKIVEIESYKSKTEKINYNIFENSPLDTIVEVGSISISNKFTQISKKTENNQYIIFDIPKTLGLIFLNKYFIITEFSIFLNYVFFYYNLIYKRRVEEIQMNFMKKKLNFQTTLILTENLHHELNTPLTVISSKISKFSQKITELSKEYEGLNTNTCNSDLGQVEASLSIIKDILDRLRSAKNLKVYEAHRTFYEVLKSSCEMVKISTSETFDYEIDEKLKEFKVNSNFIKNGEFSGILINCIKNSIEADSTLISFRYNDCLGGKCSFYISDNGHGIDKEVVHNIFSENFSSKKGIRGNGLYINKFLIENAKGSIDLKHTSSKGTVFLVRIPTVLASLEEINRSSEDIDIVKKLETDLTNSENILQQLIDSLPDMVWLKGLDGKYIIANKAIKEGLLFDDYPIGKTDIEMATNAKFRFGDENHTFGETCSNSDVITLANDEPSRFLESGNIKGSVLFLEVYKNIIKDVNGNIVGVCGSGRDLTEYIQAVNNFEESCGKCVLGSSLRAFEKYKFEG
jgi:signal transduction histidine kinase